MSDMRFTIIGIGLIFVGFIILGGFGQDIKQQLLNQMNLEHAMNIQKICHQ
jgi:hypothetical protein